jgi:hypothetical protein
MFALLHPEKDTPSANPSAQVPALALQKPDITAVRISAHCLKRSVEAPEIIARRFS